MSDAEQIHAWYKALKANSTCLAGKKAGYSVELGRVEFHHMNAGSKRDTLSSMAIKPLIPCLNYKITPVHFALEVMKVVPLAPERHKELHKAEEKGETHIIASRYDFDADPFYQREIKAFREMALDMAPAPLRAKVHDGMLDLLEAGKIVFGKQGYALV